MGPHRNMFYPRKVGGTQIYTNIFFFLNVHELFYLLALSNRQAIVTPKTKKYLVIKLLVFGRLSQLA